MFREPRRDLVAAGRARIAPAKNMADPAPWRTHRTSTLVLPLHPATASVKGFGCRPVAAIRGGSEGRRPKASQEGTRGPPCERAPSMGIRPGSGSVRRCAGRRGGGRVDSRGDGLEDEAAAEGAILLRSRMLEERPERVGRQRCIVGSEVRRRAGVVKRRGRVSWRRCPDRALRQGRGARCAAAPKALDDDHAPPQQGHGGQWSAA
jgi:hypothetical protein